MVNPVHFLLLRLLTYIDQLYNMTTLADVTPTGVFLWATIGELVRAWRRVHLIPSRLKIRALTDGSTWSYPISKMIFGCPFYTDYYTNNCNNTTDWDTLLGCASGNPKVLTAALTQNKPIRLMEIPFMSIPRKVFATKPIGL